MTETKPRGPVAQILKRINLDDLIPVMETQGIDKIYALKKLVEDESRFAELVPSAEQRDKIKESLAKSAPPQGDASNAAAASAGSAQAGPRACRDFHTKGTCGFGADCKFSHDPNAVLIESGERNLTAAADSYSENVTIHVDMVKFLLKDKGKAIGAIHRQHHTSNERIHTIVTFEEYVTFAVHGSKDNVKAAIKDIHHVIGIEGQQRKEARYQYAANELDFNKRSIDYLVTGNVKNSNTPLELSKESLMAVANTFRFVAPPQVHHFVIYAGATDKEKNEKLLPLIKSFPAIQAMLFVAHNRVSEMEKRASTVKAVFKDVPPVFVQREHSKEERMRSFQSFRDGTGPATADGASQRLIVTNNDFAKLARKVQIPYANLVVHFNATDKETYAHQMMCTGRRGKPGISLLFADPAFTKDLVAGLEQDYEMTHLDGSSPSLQKWKKCVESLSYDTTSAPLTKSDDYPGQNWEKELAEEKQRNEENKVRKQTPPKPKPKGKKAAGKKSAGGAGGAGGSEQPLFDSKPWAGGAGGGAGQQQNANTRAF